MLNRKGTEEEMGLFDEKMYGTSMLAKLFIHSCICSNEQSSVALQKKTEAPVPSFSVHYLYVCTCWQSVPMEN